MNISGLPFSLNILPVFETLCFLCLTSLLSTILCRFSVVSHSFLSHFYPFEIWAWVCDNLGCGISIDSDLKRRMHGGGGPQVGEVTRLGGVTYTCQLSRLRVENFNLTPAHACGAISHAWLKNVSCCRLACHNFQKYVNSDPCKEQKQCAKWINDNTFLTISDFWSEKHWERARVYTPPKTGTR